MIVLKNYKVGDYLLEFSDLKDEEKKILWADLGGMDFIGHVGRVRRLAKIVPQGASLTKIKFPFIFYMDGKGIYFGNSIDGLWNIFGGKSKITRILWGKIIMRNKPKILVADVALGKCSLLSQQNGINKLLHNLVAWVRIPILTPSRFYFFIRKILLKLDSYETNGVKFFPYHGEYTVVIDKKRIIWHSEYYSIEEYYKSFTENKV